MKGTKDLQTDHKVKAGYKPTEVGMIPEDWNVHNIAENSTMKARIGWQGLTTAEYLNMGEYYLVTGTDFFDGKIRWETCHYVAKERFDQDKNIQVKQNDILITKDGTIGKVAFTDELPLDATLNSGVFVIRPINNAYDPKYCYYVFKSQYFDSFLRKLVAGSTINHLYQKDFTSFQFPLPPTKAEQTAIATALSDMDNLIAGLEKLIEKKKAIKQGAMQKCLNPDFYDLYDDHDLKDDHKKSTKSVNQKNHSSDKWVVKKLGKVFEFKQGVQCAVEKQSLDNGGGLKRFIRIIDLTQPNELPRYIEDPGRVHHISKTDLFMVRYGNPGLLGYGYTGVIANNLFQLIPKIKIYPSFFYHLLSYKSQDILQLSSSTTMAALNFTALKELTLAYPVNNTEQTNIANFLNDLDNEIKSLEKNLSKYQLLKQGIMQELLTGKTRLV